MFDGFPGRHAVRGTLIVALLFSALLPAAADGIISYLEGDVTVQRGMSTFSADIGTSVQQGDVIVTGARSTAVIRLARAADIKLRENSSVDLTRIGEQIEVGLNSGGLFSRILSRLTGGYQVRADTVVGGVRGTEFFVAYGRTIEDLPDVWLCVNSGEVEVSVIQTGAAMPVREGEGVNILAGLRLSDAQRYRWTERLNWNMDPSAGAVFDATDLDAAYADLLDQDYD